MSEPTTPAAPNALAASLPPAVYRELIYQLRNTIPPPVTDNPAWLDRRDQDLIARVASFAPANAAEAHLALAHAVAVAHMMDCYRLAAVVETPPARVEQCQKQAGLMMRQAQGALNMLQRVQKERRQLEKHAEAQARAREAEQATTDLMTQAATEQLAPNELAILDAFKPGEPEPDPETLDYEQRRLFLHHKRLQLIRKITATLKDPTFNEQLAELHADPKSPLSKLRQSVAAAGR